MQFRRVVVAVDGTPTSLAALEATSELASVWGSEVVGLFVEDRNLLRMASLPFAREVGSHSGAHRAINPDQFERQFRLQAERARNMLWFIAERSRLSASFFVARGSVRDELLKALAGADMLSLGKGGRSVAARLGLGTNAKAVAAGAGGIALFLSHVASVSGPPAVIYDGSELGTKALGAAVELARALGTRLVVLCPAEVGLDSEALEEQARRAVEQQQITLEFRQILTRNVPDIARYVRFSGANVAVVPAESSVLTREAIETLLTRFSGPVMLVGAPKARKESTDES